MKQRVCVVQFQNPLAKIQHKEMFWCHDFKYSIVYGMIFSSGCWHFILDLISIIESLRKREAVER